MSREEYALNLAREHIAWCHRAGGCRDVLARHLEAIGCAGLSFIDRRSFHPVRVAAFAAAWLSLGLDAPQVNGLVEIREAA